MAAVTPALPRIATNFDPFTGYTLTGTSVLVANGASIATGISTAIAQGKQIVELTAGGIYVESVTLPAHSFSWMMLRTAGVTTVKGTRITPATATTQNFATIKAPDNSYGVVPAISAGRWILESFTVTANSTAADTHALVSLVNEVDLMTTSLTQISYKMAARHLYVVGVGSDAYGTNGRRAGITAGANECEISDCWIAKINYAGTAYAGQSQTFNAISGLGKLRIENNFVWGASEPMAWGGANQTIPAKADQICYSDIIVRGNHFYRTPAVIGVQAAENGIEFKIGRRILIENNIIENGWPTTQHGCGLGIWSAEAEDPSTAWASTSDVTIRNNWFKNYAQCAFITARYNAAITRLTRVRITNNLWTGMGGGIATSKGDPINIPNGNYTARLFDIDNDVHDVAIENNTMINTGGYLIVTSGTNSTDGHFTRFDFRNNLVGQTAYTGNTLQNPGTAFSAGWTAMNANGDCRWEGNIILVPGLSDVSIPNGGVADSLVNALADLQLVNSTFLMGDTTKYADLANCDFAVGSPYHGLGRGCDIPTLITALTGVEAPANQLALYA